METIHKSQEDNLDYKFLSRNKENLSSKLCKSRQNQYKSRMENYMLNLLIIWKEGMLLPEHVFGGDRNVPPGQNAKQLLL